MTADNVTAQDEVVDICRDLIRIDTSNPGDHSGPGERQAAEYTAAKLSEAGLEPTVLESHPKRTSVVARIEGKNPERPALLVHGHLDVVPASAPRLANTTPSPARSPTAASGAAARST